MNSTTVLVLVVVVLVAILMLIILTTAHKHTETLNKEKYQEEWRGIVESIDQENNSTMQMAIMNADKLLDKAMKELGIPGVTMADRLKLAKNRFSKVDDIWFAHKVRNQVAHETDYKLNISNTNKVLMVFKRGLKELGAI